MEQDRQHSGESWNNEVGDEIVDRVVRWCSDNGVGDARVQAWCNHGVRGLSIVPSPTGHVPAHPPIADISRDELIALLRAHHGNITQLADTLHTFRVYLRRLLRRLDLDPDLYRPAATGRQQQSYDAETRERRPRRDITLH